VKGWFKEERKEEEKENREWMKDERC